MRTVSCGPVYSAILLLLMYCPVFLFAQKKAQVPVSILKINPVAAFDMQAFPTIQFSFERKITKRVSIAGEFGYQLYQLSEVKVDTTLGIANSFYTTNSDTSFVRPSGFKANIECRYYFLRFHSRRVKTSIYAATNFFYRTNKTDLSIVYYKDSVAKKIDCYWLRRINWGGLQVIGVQLIYKKIAIDLYTGVGIMDRTVYNYNREYDASKDKIIINRHGFGSERKYFSEYSEGTVAFSAGARIGIVLK